MEDTQRAESRFPRELVEWAGYHSGGVKRLFDDHSGRPGKDLLRTNLISKLESWATDVAAGATGTPRILLLVGGPGNGKTEAIEHTIKCLDRGLSANGRLIEVISQGFHPPAGQPVPRIVRADAGSLASIPRRLELDIVQDATTTSGHEPRSARALLIEELHTLMHGADSRIYLCCVNRGVLDDALIHAIEAHLDDARRILEAITRSVSLSATAPSCWPLDGFPQVAVWPMDVESLLTSPDGASPSPAATLLEHAITPDYWPVTGTCPAGSRCPHCQGRALLAREEPRAALLQILRWYELASSKRWNFRDLFSLLSYLLAGHYQAAESQHANPCDSASNLLKLDASGATAKRPTRHQLTAIFHLATASYQHALFHLWDSAVASSLRQDIKDLGLNQNDDDARVILGLLQFLQERKTPYLPAAISSLLMDLAGLLDPALASPDSDVAVSARNKIILRELDIRFSRSLPAGIEYVRKYHVLSVNELDLLERLAKAENLLSSPMVRRKRPAAASRIQRTLRDFSCRLVRRSICTRSAVVADADILQSFQQVVEDVQGRQLFEVGRHVKNLLNGSDGFEASLTTTFGQPLPPKKHQATLVVPPQLVHPLKLPFEGRPRSPICFLQVGQGQSTQPIALTYDLFKAVKELERGLSPAALPLTVVALLDTTRARLSGPIVRDESILMNALIRIGADGIEIGKSWDGFVATKNGRSI